MHIFLLIIRDLPASAIGSAAGIFIRSPQIISKAYRAVLAWYESFDQSITAGHYQ